MSLEIIAAYPLEFFAAVLVPTGSAALFVIRHFWLQTKCFHLLQQRVETQESQMADDRKTHRDIQHAVNSMNVRLSALEGKMDILIKKAE